MSCFRATLAGDQEGSRRMYGGVSGSGHGGGDRRNGGNEGLEEV